MVHPPSFLAATSNDHLFSFLLFIIFILCRSFPQNQQPILIPQQKRQSPDNISKTFRSSLSLPIFPNYPSSSGNWKFQPMFAHAADPTKRPSQESSKKWKPIGFASSVPPKNQTSPQSIKHSLSVPCKSTGDQDKLPKKSMTQPWPPPSPTINCSVKDHPSTLQAGAGSSNPPFKLGFTVDSLTAQPTLLMSIASRMLVRGLPLESLVRGSTPCHTIPGSGLLLESPWLRVQNPHV
jgi:hypothetical protein